MPDSLLTEYRNRFFESLSQILDDEQYFDVYILCKNEKMLGAHKVIMCSASSFFKSKFEYEAASAATNIVLMTDVDSIIMKIIIKFIYSGMLPSSDCKVITSANDSHRICRNAFHNRRSCPRSFNSGGFYRTFIYCF